MMTIYEYFADALWEEEVELWAMCEGEEDFDLRAWCLEHGVDPDAVDAHTGELVLTLWAWDMCGD